MKHNTATVTGGDILAIVTECVDRILLSEDIASRSRKRTERVIESLFLGTYGQALRRVAKDGDGNPILTQRGDTQTLLQYLERQVRSAFFHNDHADIRFEPGIARIAYGELGMQGNEDRASLQRLGAILKVVSQAHAGEYDPDLNGMTFAELDRRFGGEASAAGRAEVDRVDGAEYSGGGGYTIVRIESFEEARRFYRYTNPSSRWCITHMENMFDTYTGHGANTVYFAYRAGFETMEPVPGEGCPLDEYGLSLLSIIMSPDYGDGGGLAYCTCRWNHANGGGDSVLDARGLSEVLGGSVFRLCPCRRAEVRIDGDLGLPSGTRWAVMNVGARDVTDAGKYFAWGASEGYYGNQITQGMFTREWYSGQEKTDWGRLTFGDGSSVPTPRQFRELIDNCDYAFITYRGVKGGLFTSRVNGNSLFFPAAGSCFDGSLYNAGVRGLFWSCAHSSGDGVYAHYLYFGSGEVGLFFSNRVLGLPVRPVFV